MDKDMMYECLECGKRKMSWSYDMRIDGRRCKHCGAHLSPAGYVIVGMDLAKGKDKTGYAPPIKQALFKI